MKHRVLLPAIGGARMNEQHNAMNDRPPPRVCAEDGRPSRRRRSMLLADTELSIPTTVQGIQPCGRRTDSEGLVIGSR
ncbi:hypothetical protein EVAR_81490_1 [Eumeta japonica]|uniref:Uncharacterized protein n=1 Tax=Eumeta variegata TaxID=151549 RepID=A0A4C1W2F1_EUMVA|nr:hypothetical protein EVAR_81490_1 [Eumeta japonica]